MTKRRTPQSFEAALDKIRGDLTRAGMAAAVERCESLVQQWTDPDINVWPSPQQCVALDAAWLDQGHPGTAPILAAYHAALSDQGAASKGNYRDVRDELLDAQEAMHHASATIRDAIADGVLTPNEHHAIRQCAAIVKAEIDEAVEAAAQQCRQQHLRAAE